MLSIKLSRTKNGRLHDRNTCAAFVTLTKESNVGRMLVLKLSDNDKFSLIRDNWGSWWFCENDSNRMRRVFAKLIRAVEKKYQIMVGENKDEIEDFLHIS